MRSPTMPIYQYACENCGHQMEVIQKITDSVLVDCTACQKSTLRKQITAAAFRLKGTGWYETDFKGSKKSEKPSSDSTSDDSAKKQTETSAKTV